MSAFVTRFAPSPTGLLHRGHAFSALTAWTAAREAGRTEAMEARLQAQLRGTPGADGEGDEEVTFEAVAADDDSAGGGDGEGDEEMLRVRVQSSDGSEQEVMMSRSSLDALIAQQQEQQQE